MYVIFINAGQAVFAAEKKLSV